MTDDFMKDERSSPMPGAVERRTTYSKRPGGEPTREYMARIERLARETWYGECDGFEVAKTGVGTLIVTKEKQHYR